MTDAEQMRVLAERAAEAVLEFANFMNNVYPGLLAQMTRGQALQGPMKTAVAELEAFVAAHPEIPVPKVADVEQRPNALMFAAPSPRH